MGASLMGYRRDQLIAQVFAPRTRQQVRAIDELLNELRLQPQAGATPITGPLTNPIINGAIFRTAARTVTQSGTILLTDWELRADATAGNLLLTLPTALAGKGVQIHVKKIDLTDNTVTVAGAGNDQIDGGATAVLTVQHESITIASDGSQWDIL